MSPPFWTNEITKITILITSGLVQKGCPTQQTGRTLSGQSQCPPPTGSSQFNPEDFDKARNDVQKLLSEKLVTIFISTE